MEPQIRRSRPNTGRSTNSPLCWGTAHGSTVPAEAAPCFEQLVAFVLAGGGHTRVSYSAVRLRCAFSTVLRSQGRLALNPQGNLELRDDSWAKEQEEKRKAKEITKKELDEDDEEAAQKVKKKGKGNSGEAQQKQKAKSKAKAKAARNPDWHATGGVWAPGGGWSYSKGKSKGKGKSKKGWW